MVMATPLTMCVGLRPRRGPGGGGGATGASCCCILCSSACHPACVVPMPCAGPTCAAARATAGCTTYVVAAERTELLLPPSSAPLLPALRPAVSSGPLVEVVVPVNAARSLLDREGPSVEVEPRRNERRWDLELLLAA